MTPPQLRLTPELFGSEQVLLQVVSIEKRYRTLNFVVVVIELAVLTFLLLVMLGYAPRALECVACDIFIAGSWK